MNIAIFWTFSHVSGEIFQKCTQKQLFCLIFYIKFCLYTRVTKTTTSLILSKKCTWNPFLRSDCAEKDRSSGKVRPMFLKVSRARSGWEETHKINGKFKYGRAQWAIAFCIVDCAESYRILKYKLWSKWFLSVVSPHQVQTFYQRKSDRKSIQQIL